MLKKVILINGAPGSGKDTLSEAVIEAFADVDFTIGALPMKDTLLRTAMSMFGISEGEWFERYNDSGMKDEPWERLEGMSQREALIWISEDICKPKFGKDFFAQIFIDKVNSESEYMDTLVPEGFDFALMVPDAGFQEELEAVVKEYFVENVVMINTVRDGCTFDNDSRSLLTGEDLGIKGYTIENNGTQEEFETKAFELVKEILSDDIIEAEAKRKSTEVSGDTEEEATPIRDVSE